jgi:hypothetical protein
LHKTPDGDLVPSRNTSLITSSRVRGLDGQAEVVGDDPAAFTTNEGE